MFAKLRRAPRWARLVSLAGGLSLAAVTATATGVFPGVAQAGTDGTQVSGTFQFAGKALIGCPVGAVLCTSGSFSGGFQANFQFSILTLLPSATPLVEYFNGKLVAHATGGDLNCDLNGALDANSTSPGEFGEICVVTGGTGVYQGATGHFRLTGLSTLSPILMIPSGGGDFKGQIITKQPLPN